MAQKQAKVRENGTPPGFERARKMALKVAKDRSRTLKVVHEAVQHAREHRGALRRVGGDLFAMLRLLRAWAQRDYRQVPWRTVVWSLAAVLYFASPIDLIPDMLAGIGLVDDIALLGFVADNVRKDLQAFQQWETRSKTKRLPSGS